MIKCSAFSVMHLLSLHLVSTLPRPHAAVRFLSLRGERNQRRAGVASLRCRSGRRPVCVPPAHGAPSTPGVVLPGKSRAARTIYLRGRYPGNMSFDACRGFAAVQCLSALRVTKRRPPTGTLAILRLRKFLRIFGVRLAGSWWAAIRRSGRRSPVGGRYFDRQPEASS